MNLPATISLALMATGLGLFATPAMLEHAARKITVIDGDTVSRGGVTYRLTNFDAPETGSRARCRSERELGNAAKRRLQQIVDQGVMLDQVPCACRPGTEGSRECNWGRSCAVMKLRGQDVAGILIGEGLARAYVCSEARCPKRQGWCT